MSKHALGNVIKVLGLLSLLGALAAKAMPHIRQTNPRLRKKMDTIGKLLNELKDEVADLAATKPSLTLKTRKK